MSSSRHTVHSYSCCIVLMLSLPSASLVNADGGGDSETSVLIEASAATPAEQLERHLGKPLTRTNFHGFVQHEFEMDGVPCKLVSPAVAGAGTPWIWRARFWGHEPQLDVALLRKGWHVCYCDVSDLFGNQEAIRRWDRFYRLSQRIGLQSKPLLEGMSRGGLVVMRWAAVNPERVSGIYVDNAVMDIRSWPGGKGAGSGSPNAWQTCLDAYQMTDDQTQTFEDGPLHRLSSLVRAGVPIFAMINEADSVVPPSENSDILVQRYRELGGAIQELRRPELGHHPHSLKDPAPLVDFALEAVAE